MTKFDIAGPDAFSRRIQDSALAIAVRYGDASPWLSVSMSTPRHGRPDTSLFHAIRRVDEANYCVKRAGGADGATD